MGKADAAANHPLESKFWVEVIYSYFCYGQSLTPARKILPNWWYSWSTVYMSQIREARRCRREDKETQILLPWPRDRRSEAYFGNMLLNITLFVLLRPVKPPWMARDPQHTSALGSHSNSPNHHKNDLPSLLSKNNNHQNKFNALSFTVWFIIIFNIHFTFLHQALF